jgi:hypothetical protein
MVIRDQDRDVVRLDGRLQRPEEVGHLGDIHLICPACDL